MSRLVGKFIGDIFVNNSGAGDGATVTYNLTNTPHSASSVEVYVNGVIQTLTTDYTVNLAGPSITFTTAPANGQSISVHYVKV